MSEPLLQLSLTSSSLAEEFDAMAARWKAGLSNASRPGAAASLRSELLELRAKAVDHLPDAVSQVLGRLAALTEVAECLAADAPEAAAEVGHFGVKALLQLGHAERGGAAGESILSRILAESSESWGDYLSLLESQDPAARADVQEPEPECFESDLQDDPPIDTQALLRLFRGPTAPGESEADLSADERASSPTAADRISGVRMRSDLSAASTPGGGPIGPAKSTSQFQREEPSPEEPVIPDLPATIDLDDEIRAAFLADATELFERIEGLVVGLPLSDHAADDQAELRRALHTLKGAAGSVGLADLAGMVHVLEERLESDEAPSSPGMIDALHAALGYLDGILGLVRRPSKIVESRHERTGDAAAERGQLVGEETPSSTPRHEPPAASDEGPVRVPAARFDDLMDMVSELIVRRRLWSAQVEPLKAIESTVRGCRGRMLDSLDRLYEAGLNRAERAGRLAVRADVPGQMRRLEELSDDLAVLAETSRSATAPLADQGDALGRLAVQLWDELQSIRIVPVRGLFQRLARVAHEAARVEDRQVDVVMLGEETGVDRAVQDKAYEPLLHVVRNSVGHGIEPPGERSRAGKPAAGRITLEARREGNTLVLSVADDGRGLDLQAIEAKGRRVGLIKPDERPGPEKLRELIFHPGFSTKSEANAISGRGVGMDVVAREFGVLKGTIELTTEPRKGTRLTIRLPARLALETAMVVLVDGQAFAIPVSQIEQVSPLGHPEAAASEGPSQRDDRESWHWFRDQSIPVLHAREILETADTPPPPWPKLLVVRHGGGLVGLVVDAIVGTEDLVIKSLGSLLAGHPLISGTSLSSAGEVITVLDPSRLHRWIRVGPEQSPRVAPTAGRADDTRGTPSVLVVDDSISVRKVLAKGLQAMRLDVDEVSDGLEALGRLRSRAYDLVVTDLEMPRLDGFELVSEMQRVSALARIPVIVASTRNDEETQRRVLSLGARQFLSKPVAPEVLVTAVSPLLPRSNRQEQRIPGVEV